MIYKCPYCANILTGVIQRDLRQAEVDRLNRRAHAQGSTYVVREPVGYTIIGQCQKHGLVQETPMQAPRMVKE